MCTYILLLVYGKVQKSTEKAQVRSQVTTSKWRIADGLRDHRRRLETKRRVGNLNQGDRVPSRLEEVGSACLCCYVPER